MSLTLSRSQSKITLLSFFTSRSWNSERYVSSFLSLLMFPTLIAVTCHFFSAAESSTACNVDNPSDAQEKAEGITDKASGLTSFWKMIYEITYLRLHNYLFQLSHVARNQKWRYASNFLEWKFHLNNWKGSEQSLIRTIFWFCFNFFSEGDFANSLIHCWNPMHSEWGLPGEKWSNYRKRISSLLLNSI